LPTINIKESFHFKNQPGKAFALFFYTNYEHEAPAFWTLLNAIVHTSLKELSLKELSLKLSYFKKHCTKNTEMQLLFTEKQEQEIII